MARPLHFFLYLLLPLSIHEPCSWLLYECIEIGLFCFSLYIFLDWLLLFLSLFVFQLTIGL